MREDYRERFRILGLRIAYYRKMRGMTQEQFAEALETLFLMSEKLGISMARLFED